VIVTPPPKETAVAASRRLRGQRHSRLHDDSPFRELVAGRDAAATLRAAGFEPEQRVPRATSGSVYWVFIQAIPTKSKGGDPQEGS